MKKHERSLDVNYVSVKGPNGHYWIVVSLRRDSAHEVVGVEWVVLNPSGTIRDEGFWSADRFDVPKMAYVEWLDTAVTRHRQSLRRYFKKWTLHNGIPIPP